MAEIMDREAALTKLHVDLVELNREARVIFALLEEAKSRGLWNDQLEQDYQELKKTLEE